MPISTPGYDLKGRFTLAQRTGLITGVAAYTTTAGHLFAFRWDPATTALVAYIRRIGIKFTCTTAYGTAQETGFSLFLARAYSVNHTGGTAIDLGSTDTNVGKRRKLQATSAVLVNSCRIATTGELTAGTHTIDVNATSQISGWTGAIGHQIPAEAASPGDGYGNLWDSRASGDHIELTADEGFIIANVKLMGATGVGQLAVTVDWDEGIPNGGGL